MEVDLDGLASNIKAAIGGDRRDEWRFMVDELVRNVKKLEAFKAYVHQRLDEAGVPTDPDSQHRAEGCRIGGRLDIVLAAYEDDDLPQPGRIWSINPPPVA